MSQIEILSKELTNIKRDVTQQDKKDCMKKMNVHGNTIQNYLNGKGRDADMAAKMIAFYKKQIEKRNAVIA